MSDLSDRVRQAQAFRDGTPFATPALDAALNNAVEALESIIPRNVPGNQKFGPEQDIATRALTCIERALSEGK